MTDFLRKYKLYGEITQEFLGLRIRNLMYELEHIGRF